MKTHRKRMLALLSFGSLLGLGLLFAGQGTASAAVPPPGAQSGTVGVEATIPSDPPTVPATVATPGNGQTFTEMPIAVNGLCVDRTIVKVFSNEIFVGSAECQNGTYNISISLFSGRNDIVVRIFDALDQPGPDSKVITVNFEDAQFVQFGSHVLLTSQYARRAADPGDTLEWPVIVSSGLGPYALSADWGDGTPIELRSEPFAGTLSFKHIYKSSGVYRVTFKVTDKNGTTGYLQVIAVVTGEIVGGTAGKGNKTEKQIIIKSEIAWWPMAALAIPAILTFWLGRKFELTRLRKRLEQDYR